LILNLLVISRSTAGAKRRDMRSSEVPDERLITVNVGGIATGDRISTVNDPVLFVKAVAAEPAQSMYGRDMNPAAKIEIGSSRIDGEPPFCLSTAERRDFVPTYLKGSGNA
jgi:hypothetical protein